MDLPQHLSYNNGSINVGYKKNCNKYTKVNITKKDKFRSLAY